MNLPTRYASLLVPFALILLAAGCPGDDVAPEPLPIALSVTPQTASVLVGATTILTVKGRDESNKTAELPAGRQVTWESSNPAIASVSGGDRVGVYVVGVSEGTVTITATSGILTGTAQVNVTGSGGTADGVVFSSSRDGNSEIYIMETSGPRNLTQNSAADITPSKSGSRIYFSSDRSGNYEIYSMKFDGTDLVRLTNNSVTDHSPSVSASQIAFTREVTAGHEQIFTMNLLGQNQTNISSNTFHELNPVWNPAGTKLAYASDRDAKYGPNQYLEIYTMNADGTGVTRLTTNDDGIDYHPAWSPDGASIAFSSVRAANPNNPSDVTCYAQSLEIWVMSSTGTGLRNLSNSCRGDAWPAWSPSGSEIVFASDRASASLYAWDLWKIPSAGGAATRLTTTGKEATPAWR